jgi:Haem-binding domain
MGYTPCAIHQISSGGVVPPVVVPHLRRRRPRLRLFLIALAVGFVGIQFVPVRRTNPPVTAEIQAPIDVQAVLERACYDCHSNETRWPWYSRVAPVSWLVAKDVADGRKKMNFSEWGTYHPDRQESKIEEIWEEVSKDEMPLAIYRPLHPEAKLTDADRALIERWALPVEP